MPVANRKNLLQAFPKVPREVLIDMADKIRIADDPHGVDSALSLAYSLLQGHGIESIRGDWVDHYYQDIQVLYVNMGDTYETTILYDTVKRKFYVDSWGDWYERAERQGRVGEFKP